MNREQRRKLKNIKFRGTGITKQPSSKRVNKKSQNHRVKEIYSGISDKFQELFSQISKEQLIQERSDEVGDETGKVSEEGTESK